MSEPVTKQDLLDAEARIISALKTDLLDAEARTVTALKTYVDERCEQVETKLLTAFHAWASPSDARQRTHAAAIRALDLEMESLDDRLRKLEGGQTQ